MSAIRQTGPQTVSEIHPRLFHYTTQQGLFGILESQRLWATHCAYLNDSQELQHARSLLQAAFKSRVHDYLSKRVESGNMEIRADHSPESLAERDKDTYVRVLYSVALQLSTPFIASFCTHGEGSPQERDGLLSQWRGYGRDGGFAIEFDTKELEETMESDAAIHSQSGYHLINAVYADSAEKDAEVQDDINALVPMVDKLLASIFEKDQTAPDVGFSYDPFIRCITRVKHEGFKEEAEVRCVYMRIDKVPPLQKPPRPIRFRQSARSLIPYLELFEPGLKSLKRIIVGPHPDGGLRRTALETYLRAKDLDIKVTVSGIPYLPS